MGIATALRLVETEEVSWPEEVVRSGVPTRATGLGWERQAASTLELVLQPQADRGAGAVRAVRSYDLAISPRWSTHSSYMLGQLMRRRRGGFMLAGLSLIAVAIWAGAHLV